MRLLSSSTLLGFVLLYPCVAAAQSPAAPAAAGTPPEVGPAPAVVPGDPVPTPATGTTANTPSAPAATSPTTPPELGTTPAASETPPKIVFDTAPLPAPNGADSSRTFHYHDGFYARFGLNYGITGGSFSLDDRQLDYTGSQLGMDLLLGGTPSDGLAVGGGVTLGSLLQPDMEVDGTDVPTKNVPLLLVGPFVDGFFSPQGEWHAGALFGLAVLGETRETEGAAGFGGSVWLGYDRWVGDDWAIGGQLRFLGIAAGGEKPSDFSASAIGVGLGFSVLHH